MSYTIHVTARAKADLINASDYIDTVLKNPKAADDLITLFDEKITALEDDPERHTLAQDKLLAAWGIRFTLVNQYLAFYSIDKRDKRVYIIRFLYGKRNWRAILRGERMG